MLPHVPDAPKRVPPFLLFVQRQSGADHSCFVIRHSPKALSLSERVVRRLNPFLNDGIPQLVHAPSIDSSRASR